MENKKKLNKNKKNKKKEQRNKTDKKDIKKEDKKEEINDNDNNLKEKDKEDIENIEEEKEEKEEEEDNKDEDNNWSQFLLNKKLSSNLSRIFPEPTNIQQKTLVYTNAKVDLIIQARTGEGKTLCYAIPVLNYILNFYDRSPNMQKKISPVAIILVPTHELGVQVKNHIEMVIEENSKKNIKKDENGKKRLIYNIKIENV